MTKQEQFLDVIDRDEAERRFREALELRPLGEEDTPLADALGRVLSRDIVADVDVPSFDRSNYDGFAVRAADTYGSQEESPCQLKILPERLATGVVPTVELRAGTAVPIATGGMVPRGADAIVMIEHTDEHEGLLSVRKAVTPGFGVAFTGSDLSSGEIALRRGDVLTSRETGVLAAIGRAVVPVWRTVRVAILSTGDEILPPGEPMRAPMVFDSNAQILADAVRELGGEPQMMGIVRDDVDRLREELRRALDAADAVVLSGGTSKGEGDVSYRAVAELTDPGIVAHGVALKPGKPICLAASCGKPVVILPGFPTSAIFTFHEFIAPVLRILAGRPAEDRQTIDAQMAVKVNSEIGRTEYLLVGLVEGQGGVVAYPMGKGSGSVTTFSRADGFITIGRHEEIVDRDTVRPVQLLARDLRMADLVVIGSHCIGLDFLLGRLRERGFTSKLLTVGSTAGLEAVKRGECDLAGIHLLDSETGLYNRPFLTPELELISGYGRRQGILFRADDPRFSKKSLEEILAAVKLDPARLMINRNRGSGTRILIDRLLEGAEPAGYAVQARSHSAVAAAIAQSRADWGLAIESVARTYDLGFLPVQDEQFDFVFSKSRCERPAVVAFGELLADPEVREKLSQCRFIV